MSEIQIHPTAIVDPSAKIGKGTAIGPYTIIEKGVVIGERNQIDARVFIASGTTLGNDNHIFPGAIVGHEPQDLSFKKESLTFTKIGDRNMIREYVTIHRGVKEGSSTEIGSDNYLMNYCHVAHNCKLADRVIMVPHASLSGCCEIGEGAFLSGFVGLHQFSKIGTLAIISALSAVNKDIPPYMMAGGRPATVQGINVIGLRRSGFPPEVRTEIKEAYKLLYKSGLNTTQALEKIKAELKSPQIKVLVDFIEGSERGIAAGLGEETETLLTKKGARASSHEELI